MPAIIASIIGLPKWAKGLGLIAIGVAAFLLWDWLDDRSAIREHEANIAAQVQTQASEAAVAASDAVAETKAGVEADNARARNAAAKSSDPLRDGLRELGK